MICIAQLAVSEAEESLSKLAKELVTAKAAAGEWQAHQTATQQQLVARAREISEQDLQIKVWLELGFVEVLYSDPSPCNSLTEISGGSFSQNRS